MCVGNVMKNSECACVKWEGGGGKFRETDREAERD